MTTVPTLTLLLKPFPKAVPFTLIRRLVADKLGIPFENVFLRKEAKAASIRITTSEEQASVLSRLGDLQVKGRALQFFIRHANTAAGADADAALNDQVTSLWSVPYGEQLVQKQQTIERILRPLTSIAIDPIVASPQPLGYRNKCEFTVGPDAEGKATVGFLLGGFREGILQVHNATNTLHTHPLAKDMANKFEAFVRKSPLPFYDRATKSGFWRLLLCRIHDGDKVMLACQVQDGIEGAEAEKKRFQSAFVSLTHSLWWQPTQAVHNGLGTSFELLSGSDHLWEQLSGQRFRISPGSFFQVNLPACELLYALIRDYSRGDDKRHTLLDLCCGTGTIGISMASSFDKVVGVECVPEAIKDAERNAVENGITNIEFHAKKLEDCLSSIVSNVQGDLTVVLDPPRAGCHKSVIRTILDCASRIRRLVYVACSPEQALPNMSALLAGGFAIKKAQPVDMFPHTAHCELVVLFERPE